MKQRERLNCPNCGAPIVSDTCEYCGTKFFDFANIDINDESYIRLKINDKLYMFKAFCSNISFQQHTNEIEISNEMGILANKYIKMQPYRTLSIDIIVNSEIEKRTKGCEKK